MGWGPVRQQIYDFQNGQCSICGEFLKGKWEIHHKLNKSQGRDDRSLANAEGRCPGCEDYMHANYPFGNYEGNLKRGDADARRDRKKNKYSQQKRRSKRLRSRKNHDWMGDREIPVGVANSDVPVSIASELPELPQGHGTDNRVQTTPAEIQARLERIERVLFPHTGG